MNCILLPKGSRKSVTHRLPQAKTRSYYEQFVDFVFI